MPSGSGRVGQVIGHMADTERVFGYRLLRIARGDSTPLAGFDQDAYQVQAGFERRTLASLVAELRAVRHGVDGAHPLARRACARPRRHGQRDTASPRGRSCG